MRYIEIATIASISLLLVLATYLIGKASSKVSALSWIGVFLLLLALNFGDGLLYLNGFYLNHPQLAGWEEGFVLLYGPTVFFFASSDGDRLFFRHGFGCFNSLANAPDQLSGYNKGDDSR